MSNLSIFTELEITQDLKISNDLEISENIDVSGNIILSGESSFINLRTIKSNYPTNVDPCGNYIDISGSALLIPRGSTASRKKSRKRSDIVQFGRWRDSFSSVLCSILS